MASSNVCWGIEIGAGAIKAIKLVREGDALTVADFAVVPHAKVLSTPDVDPIDTIRLGLGALVNQHDLSKATLAISMPGHAGFIRFAKLPPVEPKKVPDIVKFEAVQQIPFPIEEVEWDYQTFAAPGSPEVEVGIFAIKRERVMERLAICADVNLSPDFLNLSPVAVYNAVAYDLQFTEQTPGAVIVDIGVSATDLIVAEAGRVWIRTFPLGGHHFTEALASTYKLNYSKAEKLKRDVAQHEHKSQIFQAMKPVFSDLAQDIQRSLAYYKQLHPESDLKKVFGMGSTFRLMGLRKFLSQQLQLEVVRFDKLSRLNIEGTKASDFQSVALNMATAYGLALQGLGLGTINANLIPMSVIREAVWKRKTPWVIAAASLALAAGGIGFYRPLTDAAKIQRAAAGEAQEKVEQVKREGKTLIDAWKAVESGANLGFTAENIKRLSDHRAVFAHLVDDLGMMLAAANPQKELLSGAGADIPPGDRRLIEIRSMDMDYFSPSGAGPTGPITEVGSPASANASRPAPTSHGAASQMLGGGSGGLLPTPRASGNRPQRNNQRGGGEENPAAEARPLGSIRVVLVIDSTHQDKQAFVDKQLLQWLRDNADRPGLPYKFVTGNVDEMIKKVETIKSDAKSRGGAAGARPAASASPGRPSSGGPGLGGATAGARPSGGAENPNAAVALEQMAPLPPSPESTLADGDISRYTIEWEALLRDPKAVVPTPESQDESKQGARRMENR